MSARGSGPSPDELLERLDALRAALGEARRSAEAGRAPGLAALAEALSDALAGVPSLAADRRERLKLALLDLLDETERLAGLVAAAHQELRAEIVELDRRQRAGRTYGRSMAEGGYR